VAVLFLWAAAVIVISAEPFASSLISTGTELGIDKFLLVQWVAPLASESPEFIVAILFAVHGKGADAIGTLISSKVNQWTLLVGSLPIAYLAGGGATALTLDPRQVEEFLLTATQTLLGVAALLTLRFPRWLAFTLLGLFAVQYAFPGQTARYVLCAIYGVIASPPWPATTASSGLRSPPRSASRPAIRRAVPPYHRPAQRGTEWHPTFSRARPRGLETEKGSAAAAEEGRPARPVCVPVSGRSLVLVAGLPGAGKSTLLGTMRPRPGARIADSDDLRATLLRRLPGKPPYKLVRPVVHAIHRARVVGLSLGSSPTVVVHLPATSARIRRGWPG
jgi:hypothetical protein